MKKILTLLLALVLLFSFAACGNENEITEPTPDVTVTPVPTPVPEWKDLTAEYEAWVDEYIETYRQAEANPTNNALYDRLKEMGKEASDWDKRLYAQEMSMVGFPDQQEYVDEVLRITQKLNDFGNSKST